MKFPLIRYNWGRTDVQHAMASYFGSINDSADYNASIPKIPFVQLDLITNDERELDARSLLLPPLLRLLRYARTKHGRAILHRIVELFIFYRFLPGLVDLACNLRCKPRRIDLEHI